MTNPTTIVSTFDNTLAAITGPGATAWTIDSGDAEYTATAPAQLILDSADMDAISLDAATYLDPASGGVAFWYTRTTDTGGLETILECGADLGDWLRILVDSDDILYMYWASNGGLPQIVGSAETIAMDTPYFVYCEWEGITQALSINNGPKIVAPRDVITGAWGAGDLVLTAA